MNATSQAAAPTRENPVPDRANRWTVAEVEALYQLPLMDLIFRAQQVHRENFDANEIQLSSLLSVKTGGCSEDCGYCSQAARYNTETEREALLPLAEVVAAAQAAKDKGASRFCMGAAWRGPKDKDLAKVSEMIRAVKDLGLQTCVTLGMLKEGQADELKAAGLDYYNHNLDTDASFYGQVITTHKHADRIDTLGQVREAGIKVCSGGIIGMGESRRNRAALIVQLANLNPPRNRYRSTIWCRFPGRPWPMSRRSTASSSCAPSPPHGSPCREVSSACRPVGRRCRKSCRRCVSWPVPIRSSTATAC
jgi:biotin synthase